MMLQLAAEADFFATLVRNDGVTWPDGVTVEIAIDDNDPWPAVLNGPRAVWEVDETDVATVIEASPKKARLYYTEGDVRVLWASGPVVVTR